MWWSKLHPCGIKSVFFFTSCIDVSTDNRTIHLDSSCLLHVQKNRNVFPLRYMFNRPRPVRGIRIHSFRSIAGKSTNCRLSRDNDWFSCCSWVINGEKMNLLPSMVIRDVLQRWNHWSWILWIKGYRILNLTVSINFNQTLFKLPLSFIVYSRAENICKYQRNCGNTQQLTISLIMFIWQLCIVWFWCVFNPSGFACYFLAIRRIYKININWL